MHHALCTQPSVGHGTTKVKNPYPITTPPDGTAWLSLHALWCFAHQTSVPAPRLVPWYFQLGHTSPPKPPLQPLEKLWLHTLCRSKTFCTPGVPCSHLVLELTLIWLDSLLGWPRALFFYCGITRRITRSSMCVKVTPLPKTSQAKSASHVIERGRAGEDIRTLCHFTFFHHAEIKNSGKSTSFEWQLFGWTLISVAICPGLNPELNQACNFQLLPLNKSWLPFVTNNIGLWHAYCIFKTNACIMQSRNGGVELQPREEFHIHWCTESQWQISV